MDSKNAFGETIRFPRMQKEKWYIVGFKILQYKKIERDCAVFETMDGVEHCLTRRQMSAACLQLLGDRKHISDPENRNSRDVFISKTRPPRTLFSVLAQLEERAMSKAY